MRYKAAVIRGSELFSHSSILGGSGSCPVGPSRCGSLGDVNQTSDQSSSPENAVHTTFAGDLACARQHVSTRARDVQKRFDEFAAVLAVSEPGIIPPLLEEVARIFDDAGDDAPARKYFGKARETERAHNLAVDADRHRQVFLEFAGRGIISTKELTAETAAALSRYDDPAAACSYVLEIMAEVSGSGMPLYPGMVRDVRKVAKAAGMSPAVSDEHLLDAVAAGPGFLNAPEGFWKALGSRLTTYLTSHPDAAEYFGTRTPEAFDVEKYLEVLDASGQLQRMRPTPDYPAWLVDLLESSRQSFRAPTPRYYSEVALVAEGVASLEEVNLSYIGVHPALVDALVATGAEVTLGPGRNPWLHRTDRINMDLWLRDPYGDLDGLARYSTPEATPLGSLDPADLRPADLDLLLAHTGTHRMLGDWISGLAAARGRFSGALPVLGSAVESLLESLADPRLAENFAGPMEQLFSFDPAEEFAAAVRQGLIVEFTWPDFERAYEDAVLRAGDDSDAGVTVRETYPQVAVAAGSVIEILGAGGVERTLAVPDDAYSITAVYTVAGSGVIIYHDKNNRPWCRWFDDTESVPSEQLTFSWAPVTYPVADGRVIGSQLVRVGDVIDNMWPASPFITGDEVSVVPDYGAVSTFNTVTGEQSGKPVSFDSHIAAASAVGIDGTTSGSSVVWRGSRRLRLPEGNWSSSPWAHDGSCIEITGLDLTSSLQVGTTRIVTPSAVVEQDPYQRYFVSLRQEELSGLISLPGGGEHRNLARRGRATASGENGAPLSWSRTRDGSLHAMHFVPDNLWFRPEVRDGAVSAKMRVYRSDDARKVLAAVADSGRDTELSSAIVAQLGCSDVVATALTHIALETLSLDKEFERCRTLAFADVHSDEKTVTNVPGENLTHAGAQAFYPDTLSKPDRLREQARNLAAWIAAGEDGFRDPGVPGDFGSLRYLVRYLGRERLFVAGFNTACAADHEHQDPVNAIAFARELVSSGLLCNGWTVVTVAAPEDYSLRESLEARGVTWIDLGAMVHPLSFQYDTTVHGPGTPVWVLVRTSDVDKLTVDVLVGPVPVEDRLDAGEFLQLLELTERQLLPDRHVENEQAALVADNTVLPTQTARLLLGGVRADIGLLGGKSDLRFEDQEALPFYGLKAREVDMPLTQVTTLGEELVDRLTMSLLDGPTPAEGLVARWNRETGGAQPLELTDGEWTRVHASTSTFNDDTATEQLTGILMLGSDDIGFPPATLAGILAVTAELDLDDPRRPAFADVLRMLRTSAGEYVVAPEHREEIGRMPLGSRVDHPGFNDIVTVPSQTVRVLVEGHLDRVIDDLDTVYEGQAGPATDPSVAVPDLVEDVATTIGVDMQAARYFLQLLALPAPTDADVRAWNGWKKKDIDATGAELVAVGVAVTAKRTGAARRFFLPGGWLDGRSGLYPSRPVEVWKTQMYLMWQDIKAHPVVKGCPALVPAQDLFRTAWERYRSGDVPGYAETAVTAEPGR